MYALLGPEGIKPVLVDGVEEDLWISEIETIFGFTTHYTDVKNISKSARLQVLGNSWSIDTVKLILSPLINFFKKIEYIEFSIPCSLLYHNLFLMCNITYNNYNRMIPSFKVFFF